MTANIDYEKNNYIYPKLTTILGQPTYELLKIIKDELKTNAASVPCDLGGGGHGHLGKVLAPVEYTLVSPVPYIDPGHPGPLVIPAIPAYMRQEMREAHKENVRVYREADNVEQFPTCILSVLKIF